MASGLGPCQYCAPEESRASEGSVASRQPARASRSRRTCRWTRPRLEVACRRAARGSPHPQCLWPLSHDQTAPARDCLQRPATKTLSDRLRRTQDLFVVCGSPSPKRSLWWPVNRALSVSRSNTGGDALGEGDAARGERARLALAERFPLPVSLCPSRRGEVGPLLRCGRIICEMPSTSPLAETGSVM